MQRPTAVPRIPASASGVSTHRSAPNLSRRPAVARKTPPARPTSSPITSTESSRPSSVWKASLIASTSVSSATEQLPQLRQLGCKRRRRRGVGMFEDQADIGRRLGLRRLDPRAQRLDRLRASRLRKLVAQYAGPAQVGLVAPQAFAGLLLFDPLEIDRSEERRVGKECRSRWSPYH